MTEVKSLHVYEAISKVQLALSREGIAKDKKNTIQKYNFRGIDDVYNALAPELAKNELVIIPKVVSRDVKEVTNKNGTLLFYVIVTVEYTFVSAVDGSCHQAVIIGEAMDSGDKGTNKALSAAYKYLCLQTFCIPTESESVDSENNTYELETPSKKTYSVSSNAYTGKATEKQLEFLGNLIVETEADVSVILNHYKIKDLEDLTLVQAKECISRLTTRKNAGDKR